MYGMAGRRDATYYGYVDGVLSRVATSNTRGEETRIWRNILHEVLNT